MHCANRKYVTNSVTFLSMSDIVLTTPVSTNATSFLRFFQFCIDTRVKTFNVNTILTITEASRPATFPGKASGKSGHGLRKKPLPSFANWKCSQGLGLRGTSFSRETACQRVRRFGSPQRCSRDKLKNKTN